MKYYVLSFASDYGQGYLEGIYDDPETAQQENLSKDVAVVIGLPDDVKPDLTILAHRQAGRLIDVDDATTWEE